MTESDEKTAYAYDPIERTDVQIRCSHKHQNTDYDHIDGSELPVVIESNFRHESVEGCQGSFTQIEEIPEGCPNCGYDRMNVGVHTLAGIHRETCRACGVDITDRDRDDWKATKPHDAVHDLKKYGDYVGKIGHTGTTLYRRNERGDYALLAHNRTFSINVDEAISLAIATMKDAGAGSISRHEARQLLYAAGEAMQSQEDNTEEDNE